MSARPSDPNEIAACRTDLGPLTRKLLEQQQEIERLRVIVQGWEHSARNAERDMATLRAERDEARLQTGRILNEIVARLRVWSDWLNERCPDTEVRNDLRAAAAEIERLRAERDEVRQSYCSLMEAYRGGDGRVTANKLGWGYLFPRRPKKEDGK